MKRFLFTAMTMLSVIAVEGQNLIEWRNDKVTQIIFPSDIVKFRAGYIVSPTPNFDALTQSEGKVLYLQPVMPMNETNLNVITNDGYYYAFNLVYNDVAKTANYIIEPSMAFYREESPQVEPLVADVSAVGTEVFTVEEAVDGQADSLFSKVQKQDEYIVTNNVAKLQKLIFVLKGVYVDQTHIFFKFRIGNTSNVPFDIDYIAFSITAKKTKRTSSQERIQLQPIGANVDIHRVGAKSSCEVIYCFEKFTIGKDKILLAEVLEQGGDRNIVLRIPESYIIEARRL